MKLIPPLFVFIVIGATIGIAFAAPEKYPPEPVGTPHPTNAAEARSALLAQAKLLPTMKDYPEDWWANLKSGKGWSVRKIRIAGALHRVTDTLSEKEKIHAILFGTLEILGGDGECWALENYGSFGGFGSTPIAYLDAKTGSLLFIWVAPEG